MRIGICTFFNVDNYGAALQALGSLTVLKELGHSPEIINYFPAEFGVENNSIIKKLGLHNHTFHQKVRAMLSPETLYARLHRNMPQHAACDLHALFENFLQRHFVLSPALSPDNVWEYLNSLDCIYVGSDQVWRKFLPDNNFFLLDRCHGPRKISYAATFGIRPSQVENKEVIQKALSDFDALSVRDAFSQEYLKSCGIESVIVADPTILTDFHQYAQKPAEFPQEFLESGFLLHYSLDPWQGYIGQKLLRKMRAETGLPVVSIGQGNRYGTATDYLPGNIGPAEWLWLFENAAWVCTDSFHGAVFSLKNRKKFVAYYSPGYLRAQRLSDLKQKLNLPCIVDGARLPRWDWDYSAAARKFDLWKEQSYGFLKNALH